MNSQSMILALVAHCLIFLLLFSDFDCFYFAFSASREYLFRGAIVHPNSTQTNTTLPTQHNPIKDTQPTLKQPLRDAPLSNN